MSGSGVELETAGCGEQGVKWWSDSVQVCVVDSVVPGENFDMQK